MNVSTAIVIPPWQIRHPEPPHAARASRPDNHDRSRHPSSPHPGWVIRNSAAFLALSISNAGNDVTGIVRAGGGYAPGDTDGVQPPVAKRPEQPGRRTLSHDGQRRGPDGEPVRSGLTGG